MAATDKVVQVGPSGVRRVPDAGFAEVGTGIASTVGNLTVTTPVGFAAIVNDAQVNIDFRVRGTLDADLFFVDASANFIGIGVGTPTSQLDMDGALTTQGSIAPALSPAGAGRIYFDSGLNQYQVSENGGPYVSLVGGGGNVSASPTPVNNQIAVWTNATTIEGDPLFLWDGTNLDVRGGAIFNDNGLAVNFRVEGDTEANLLFIEGATDRVGVGTASPTSLFDVQGTAAGPFVTFQNSVASGATSGGCVRLVQDDATAMAASERLGCLEFTGFNDTLLAPGAAVEAFSAAVWSQAGDVRPAYLTFSTTPLAGGVAPQERIRVTSEGRVGIAQSAPVATLDVNGSLSLPITTIVASTPLTTLHNTILADATGGAITATLPSAAATLGLRYTVKKIDGSVNTVFVSRSGADTIDGAVSVALTSQYDVLNFVSNGSNWFVL